MGKLELNKKKKKDALFNTAFELFTTKGLTKTTISDIVQVLQKELFTSILKINMISGINWFPTRPENCFSGPIRLCRMHISANLTGRYILL